jgi:hypothetical protein
MADYFSEYFLGDWNHPVDITEMNRETPQQGNKKTQ